MNSSNDCHVIDGFPHLFVDAFKGRWLEMTGVAHNVFILTHYHGDHYQSLPREFKYQGPARIHCTPITASLLRDVHEVPTHLVVEHDYGETWEVASRSESSAKVTFYNAHHCPGATIVLVELMPSGKCHLHCGDMRYTAEMKEYPRLKQVVQRKALDLVYLDTTYGHPKHDFCSQSEAIDQIGTTVQKALAVSESSSTLILLSCYSIGKEKVLWECHRRTGLPICVTLRKLRMLQCCRNDDPQDVLNMCTLDATKTDIHVVPMGTVGEMWPFFQPNFPACRDYAEKLNHKKYQKVIAFIPTGWAHGSNYNKKNAVVSRSMSYRDSNDQVDVEIRLVGYSEHSAFNELVEFVSFLKPRQVIPTVYSDEADRRKIVNHFRNLVNATRAKQQFFESMKRMEPLSTDEVVPSSTSGKKIRIDDSLSKECYPQQMDRPQDLQSLIAMGFSVFRAQDALKRCDGRLEAAVDLLLSGTPAAKSAVAPLSSNASPSTLSSKASPSTITQFFSPANSSSRRRNEE